MLRVTVTVDSVEFSAVYQKLIEKAQKQSVGEIREVMSKAGYSQEFYEILQRYPLTNLSFQRPSLKYCLDIVMYFAVIMNASEAVKWVLAVEGYQPGHFNGDSPLYWASARNHTAVMQVLLTYYQEKGLYTEIDRHNFSMGGEGRSPLLIAILNQHYEAASLLLANGAYAEATDGVGNTPLHYVAMNFNERLMILLRDYAANDDIKNEYQITAREICQHSNNKQALFIFKHYRPSKYHLSGTGLNNLTPSPFTVDMEKDVSDVEMAECLGKNASVGQRWQFK